MKKIIFKIFDGLIDLLSILFDNIGDFCHSLFKNESKTEYDASFHTDPGRIVSSWNYGFTVNGLKNISIENSYKNQIVYGGSGSGKTSNIIIPNLLHAFGKYNLIVNDPSSENYLKTSGALHKHKVKIWVFDASKPGISIRFNPLARVKNINDIKRLAQLLILNSLGNGNSDPFWNISAINILTIIFRLLVFYSPIEYRTIHNALYLLDNLSYGKKVDKLIAKTGDESLISSYKSFIANDPKLANNILATAKAALGLFETDTVQQVTATDNINFQDFRNESVCLFITNNISNAKMFAPLTAVLLQQLFDFIMEELPSATAKPVFFHIDEAASIYFNSLPIIISNIRKYKSCMSLIYQSYHQLSNQYSAAEAKSVEANTWTRVYLPGVPSDIAGNLSKELGSFEFTDDNNTKHVRSLMTSSEIRENNNILVFCGNHRALNLPQKPFFKTRLKRLSNIPPYQPDVVNSSIVPPLIPLD